MAKTLIEIAVADGKYTFQSFPYDDRIHILRNGEPWVQMGVGSNAVFALMLEFEEMELRLKGLEK